MCIRVHPANEYIEDIYMIVPVLLNLFNALG